MPSIFRSRWSLIAVAVVIALVLVGLGVGAYFYWPRPPGLPGPESPTYQQYVEQFEMGLAALDTEQAQEIGGESLNKAVVLIPEEPAAWADRGLMYLRADQLKEAAGG